jgi:hypothetical protein
MDVLGSGLERVPDRWLLHDVVAAERDLLTANQLLCWRFLPEGLLAALTVVLLSLFDLSCCVDTLNGRVRSIKSTVWPTASSAGQQM